MSEGRRHRHKCYTFNFAGRIEPDGPDDLKTNGDGDDQDREGGCDHEWHERNVNPVGESFQPVCLAGRLPGRRPWAGSMALPALTRAFTHCQWFRPMVAAPLRARAG